MLKRLKVKMTAAPVVKPGEMPTVNVEGDLIQQYINADSQLKKAKDLMDDLRPEILELGVGEVYRCSIADPQNPVTTVKLQDEQDKVVRVQFTSKYGKVPNAGAVEDLFDEQNKALKASKGVMLDINDFLQETVVATFNCSVFHDNEGKFQQKVYDRFRKAIEDVAIDLEVPCPLETQKVVAVLPAFHERRWAVFKDVKVQDRLTKICPNTTQIVPVTVKPPSTEGEEAPPTQLELPRTRRRALP